MEEKTANGPEASWDQFLNHLKAVVHDGEDLLKSGFGRARQQATVRMQTADRLIHERPYQSLAVGFGLGLVAGLLISRAFGRETEEVED